ncbi:thioredoxin family protein [Planctomycetales bacterium ZRK34]|nr:thioredoxin family protein [Planctomycetales bacterium ZRK34]
MFRHVTMMMTVMVMAAMAHAAGPAIGDRAPSFELTDQNGNMVSLDQFKGKVVVLEWFNDGCPVTKQHHTAPAKTMSTLADKYKADGVVWLAINSTRTTSVEKNKKAAERFGVEYPVLDDSAGKVGQAYGARCTPHMFVIDARGMLAYNGAIDDRKSTNYIAKAVDELLAGKPVSTPQTKPYGCGIKYAK